MVEKMIFIVGSGRCGTTWVRRWFEQHPKIFAVNDETEIFIHMQHMLQWRYEKTKQSINDCMDKDRMLQIAADFVYNVFDETMGDKKYLVEKTTKHWWFVDLINLLMGRKTEVYFIHMYRDGRNVLESFLRQPWSLAADFVAGEWIEVTGNMLDGKFPSNTIHVRYEDLVLKPETSRLITEFCGIDHHGDIVPFNNEQNTFNPELYKRLLPYHNICKLYEDMEPNLHRLGYLTKDDESRIIS